MFSRLAVPFFAAVAGYYFFRINSPKRYVAFLKKYLRIYLFWTALMLVFDAVSWNEGIASFGQYVFTTIFVNGWHQLWYLLAIIYLIGVLIIAGKVSDRAYDLIYRLSFLFLFIGILVANYGKIFFRIPFPNALEGFLQNELVFRACLIVPFFMLGYRLNKLPEEREKRPVNRYLLICIAGLLIEVCLTTALHMHRNVALCLFTYPIIYYLMRWAFNNPNSERIVLAKYSAKMASVIYFGHFALMMVWVSKGVTETAVFFICVIVMGLIGAITARFNNSVINKVL